MTEPLTVAAALARGCFFCRRPLTPEVAILVAATWELIGAPRTRSEAQPAVACQSCFDKHAGDPLAPSTADVAQTKTGEASEPSRYVLFDFDQDVLLTTQVFDSYDEAARAEVNDVLILALPLESNKCVECETPDEPFHSGVPGILARVENGRRVPGAEVHRCEASVRYESDAAAHAKLRELGTASTEPDTERRPMTVFTLRLETSRPVDADVLDRVLQNSTVREALETALSCTIKLGVARDSTKLPRMNAKIARCIDNDVLNATGTVQTLLDSAGELLDRCMEPPLVLLQVAGDDRWWAATIECVISPANRDTVRERLEEIGQEDRTIG
jgi:hypothetical protein